MNALPQSPRPSWLMRLLAVAFLVVGSGAGIVLWAAQARITTSWQSAYAGLTDVGGACEVAIAAWREADTFDVVRAREHAFRPMPMPYRGRPDSPNVGQGQYLYTRCPMDLSGLRHDGFARLQLGTLYGEAAVYVDGGLRLTQSDGRMAEVPLTPDDRRTGLLVEVIARRTEFGLPGLSTLLPVVAGDERTHFDRIARMLLAWNGEMPALRIGFATAMLIAFGTAWLLGIRYPDVGWMVVTTSLLAIEHYVHYDEESALYAPVTAASRFALSLAFAAFVWSFLRVKRPSWLSLEHWFVALAGGYVALIALLPRDTIYAYNLYGGARLYVGAAAYAWAGFYGLRSHRALPAPRKWRVLAVAVLGLAASALYLLQALAVGSSAMLLDPFMNFAFAAVFSVILASDLVLYHRDFFRERARRLKAAESAARDTAVAQTTQMLAHDVRKPFVMLSTLLSQLTRGKIDTRSAGAQLAYVEQALASIDAMLQDVMLLGAQAAPATQATAVAPLLRSSLEQVFRYRTSDISLTFELRSARGFAVDPAKIQRALVNILENAAQAMRDKGEIRVSTHDAGDAVVLTLFNSGTFIGPEDRERIFEPFVTKGKVGGTGLGLAVVRRIIELHGGSVAVASERDVGTSFLVTLPAATAPDDDCTSLPTHTRELSQSAGDDASTDRPVAPEVIVLDDDPFVREAWHRELTDLTLALFETPGSLLDAIAQGRVDQSRLRCVITDYFFAGHEEEAVLESFKHMRASFACPILLSSDAVLPDRPEGVDAVIEKKPLSEERLLETLDLKVG